MDEEAIRREERQKWRATIKDAPPEIAATLREFIRQFQGYLEARGPGVSAPDEMIETVKRLFGMLQDLYFSHLHLGSKCPDGFTGLSGFLGREILPSNRSEAALRGDALTAENLEDLVELEQKLPRPPEQTSPNPSLAARNELIVRLGREGLKHMAIVARVKVEFPGKVIGMTQVRNILKKAGLPSRKQKATKNRSAI